MPREYFIGVIREPTKHFLDSTTIDDNTIYHFKQVLLIVALDYRERHFDGVIYVRVGYTMKEVESTY